MALKNIIFAGIVILALIGWFIYREIKKAPYEKWRWQK